MEESDDLLFLLSLERNEDAYKKLYNRHKIIIKKLLKKYSHLIKQYNLEYYDIYMECSYIYAKAIKSYSIYNKGNIDTYIYSCIDKGIIDYIRKNNKLCNELYFVSKDNIDLIDNIVFTKEMPINEVIKNDIKEKVIDMLSSSEIDVFNLLINGTTYEDIMSELNISKKQLYNSVSRIRNKTKLILDF